METTVMTDPTTYVAPEGSESTGDKAASKATKLAGILASQANTALTGLERAIAFLETDYVRPEMSDPKLGLECLRETLTAQPERVEAVREDAKRFRFEAFQASFDPLLKRVEAEIAEAEGHPALWGLVARLEELANESRVHWQGGRRELAINALRFGLRFAERAYQPLNPSARNGKGDPTRAKRETDRRARQLARSGGPQGSSNSSGPKGKGGKQGK